MKTVSLRLPSALNDRLASAAREQGLSKSELVRAALEAFLTNGMPAGQGSLYERTKDLIGSIDDPNVPADLASNKKYLEGYGR